jgi:hypothetical protein
MSKHQCIFGSLFSSGHNPCGSQLNIQTPSWWNWTSVLFLQPFGTVINSDILFNLSSTSTECLRGRNKTNSELTFLGIYCLPNLGSKISVPFSFFFLSWPSIAECSELLFSLCSHLTLVYCSFNVFK